MNIVDWINSNFQSIEVIRGGEYKFPCPRCSHLNFYFNIYKKVGHCHRAGCGWNPTLAQLGAEVGNLPEDDILASFQDDPAPSIQAKITLPTSDPVASYNDSGVLVTQHPEVLTALHNRGLSSEDMVTYKIHTDGKRIYVPVYYNGTLVSYIGRLIWGLEETIGPRYKYPSGVKITDHFFGWDEARTWDHMILVENTFNSIWLRRYMNCSTNFGSYLSKEQVKKISMAPRMKKIILLWDEGAEDRAYKAVRDLSAVHSAIYCKIRGQPDDHNLSEIKYYIKTAMELCGTVPKVDFR